MTFFQPADWQLECLHPAFILETTGRLGEIEIINGLQSSFSVYPADDCTDSLRGQLQEYVNSNPLCLILLRRVRLEGQKKGVHNSG